MTHAVVISRSRARGTALAIAPWVGLLALSSLANAAPLTWSGVSSSNATWTIDATNWTGATGTPWDPTNGPTNVSVFNSASGTATVGAQVSTGGLTFSAANTLVTGGTVALSGTNVLVTVSTGTSTLASTVTGSGFSKQGTGTLVLSASNTFGSGTMTFGSGSATNLGYITLANGRALGNYTTINLAGNNAAVAGLNLTGGITASYALRLDGRSDNGNSYQLKNLSGNNTLTGNITAVNTGGSYLFVSDSGTLTLSGTQNSSVTSSRNFVYSGSGAITITGPILNGGTAGIAVAKNGTGTLTLSGSNSYAGNTTVNAGTVSVTNNSGLGLGSVTIAGAGTVNLNTTTVSNTFTVNGGKLLGGSVNVARLAGTSSGTVSSTLTGTGGLTKSGATRLALAGTSTFTGVTLVSGGTLALGNAVALQNSGFDTASSGVVQLASGTTVTLGGVVGSGVFAPSGYASITSLVLNAQPGSTFTYSGNLANGGAGMSLTKSGQTFASASAPGIQVLSGTSLYSGPTSITGGVLQFARPSALYGGDTAKWTAANLTTGAGGALAVNVGGAGEFTLSDVATLLALSSGSGGFLPGAAIGLDTTNAGGSLTYATPLVDGNGGVNSLGLVKLGSGTLALTAPNTYTGATTVAGGSLVFSGAGSIPATSPGWFVSGSGAVLDVSNLAGPSYTLGSLGVAAGSTLALGSSSVTFGASADNAIAGTLTGNGGLVYTGTSVLTLSSSNGYSGPITLAAGAQAFLQNPYGLGDASVGTTLDDGAHIYFLNSANIAAISEPITIASGTATLRSGNAAAFTLSGSMTLAATASINNDAGSTITFTGPVAGTAGLVHAGGGTLVLTNTTAANTFAGGITQAGVGGITIGAAGSQGTGDITFATGGSGNLAFANVDGTIANNIVGAGGTGGVTKSGTSTTVLAGVNTYSGTTTVSSGGGALRIDAASALPAASVISLSKTGTNTGSLVLNTAGTNVYTNTFGTFFSSNSLANGGTPNVRNLQGDNTLTADMTIAATGGNGMNFTSDGGLLTLSGTLSNGVASSTRTLGLGGAGTGVVSGPIVNGTASGAATNLVKAGAGTWSLTNTANSFTGTPVILDGVIDAANLADSGLPSAMGAGTTIQFSGQGTSGTLRYTGATDQATSRALQIDATGGAIDSSGGGSLTFVGGVTATDPAAFNLTFTSGSAVAINFGSTTPGTVVGQRFTSPAVSGTVTITAINGNAHTLSSPAVLTGGGTATFVGATDRVLRLVGTNTGANTIATTLADSAAGGRLGVTKDGPGTWTLAAFNSYTGPTTVGAGTLVVGPSASVGSSRSFSVAAGGVLDVTQQASGLSLSSGQTLGGSGLVAGSVTIGSAAVVSPGSSPGTLTISQDLALGGGNYTWQMLNATGTAGNGWDLISTATLTLSSLSSADPFSINLWSLAATNPDMSGNAANFDASAAGSWRILTSGAAISGFDASLFRVNTLATAGAAGFSNPLLGGTFSVGLSNDGLGIDLLYAPATPYTWHGNGTTPGGSGTWSPVGLTWNDGSTVVAWDPSRNARFDATAGTVTISGSVTAANGLNFVTDGYTVTGDTLALAAANRATNAVNVAGGATVTFAGGLTAHNGFSKTGPGRMLITGDVTAPGGASVTSGTLAIGAGGTSGLLSADASIAAGAVLAFDRSDAFTYSGGLSGDGSVRMQGTGILMLTGTGLPTGGLLLAGGTVALVSADALGSSGPLSFDGGTLQFSAANTTDYSARFSTAAGQAFVLDTAAETVTLATGLASDGGNLTKLGDGTLVLAGPNTFTGATTIRAGAVQLGSGAAGGSVAGEIVNDAALILNRSDSFALANAISGTGVVRKLAANTVTLSSSNSFSGGTALEQGNLQVNHSAALGSGTVTITNAGGNTRLLLGGSTGTTLANPIHVSGVQNPSLGNGVLWATSGTGTLTGSIMLDNAPTSSGGMIGSSAGATLVITGPISVIGPSVDFSQRSGNVILSGTGSTGWGLFAVTGTLHNGATDALCTTATLRLGASGAATYDLAGHDQTLAALTSSTQAVVIANSSTSRDSTLTIAGGTSAFSGQIADSVYGGTQRVNLHVASGTFSLTGSTSFRGLTRIRDGVLDLGNANALAGSTLDMKAADIGALALTATAATTFNVGALIGSRGIDVGVHTLAAGANGQSTTYDGVVTGSGGLTKAGTGTLVLTATQAYTGSTGVGGGTLRVISSGQFVASSTLAFTGSNATFDIGSTTQTFAGLTTPNGGAFEGMAVSGSGGTLAIAGPGNVEVGPGGAVGTAGARDAMSLASLSHFSYSNATGIVRVGLKSGATNTAAPGTSSLTLAQHNSITAAAIGVADVSASSDGGGAQLLLGQSNAFAIGAFNQASNGRSDTSVLFAPGLTSPVLVVRGTDGSGPVPSWIVGNVATYAGARASFTSTADFSTGMLDASVTTLTIGQANNGSQTNRVGVQNSGFTMGSGTLDATSIVVGRITGGTAGTVGSGSYAAHGVLTIASGDALVRVTSLTLAENTILGTSSAGASKSVSGEVNLSAGTLQAGSIDRGAQTGNATSVSTVLNWTGGTITHLSGSDLTMDSVPVSLSSGTGTFLASAGSTISVNTAAPITGGGAVVKSGAGRLVLAGANTYSGATTVSAGTMVINGFNSGTGAVTVASTATLAGTGTISGDTTILSAATLAPGASPGTLSFAGGLTWNSGGNYDWQMISGTGTAGASDAWDLARVGGPLTIAATSADPFRINLWTLAGSSPDVSGTAANFDPAQTQTWTIASAAGGISGFAADKFLITTSATNGTGGFANALGGGTFSLAQSGNDLNLVFTASGGPPTVITINVASGSQTQVAAGYPLLSGTVPVVKTGAGTLVVDQANTLTGSTTVQGGVLQMANASALSASRLVVVAGGTGQVAPYTSTSVAGLDLTGNGLVDVTTGALTIASGLSAAQLVAELLEGRGDGSWNGTSGITSSTAAGEAASSIPRSVGWLDNGDGSLMVAYAAPGDTNIDWSIDILDAANFLALGKFDTGAAASWIEGDFSYDGIVDILDAADFFSTGLFDAGNYNAAPAGVGGIAAVPEPAGLGAIGLVVAAIAAAGRRPARCRRDV